MDTARKRTGAGQADTSSGQGNHDLTPTSTSEIQPEPLPTDSEPKAGPVSTPSVKTAVLRRRLEIGAIAGVCVFMVIAAIALQHLEEGTTVAGVFTPDQLRQYDGTNGKPLYLALLGEVFDVSKGSKHYGPGGGYSFFTGKDASRAFVTGDFKNDLNDNVEDLTPENCHGLVEWLSFYNKDYTHVGRVRGAFYDSGGRKLPALSEVRRKAAAHQRDLEYKKEAEKQQPACSMRWSQAAGGAVWCDGGQYPRKVFEKLPGGQPHTRCACFATPEWSDQRQLYSGCAPDASECQTSPPES